MVTDLPTQAATVKLVLAGAMVRSATRALSSSAFMTMFPKMLSVTSTPAIVTMVAQMPARPAAPLVPT